MTVGLVEQFARRRIVQIDVVGVRHLEFHEAEDDGGGELNPDARELAS